MSSKIKSLRTVMLDQDISHFLSPDTAAVTCRTLDIVAERLEQIYVGVLQCQERNIENLGQLARETHLQSPRS